MRILRGEIYWIDFGPTVGSEIMKVRPAVIIQNDVGNLNSPTTIVAAITSTSPAKNYPFVVRVQDGEGGLAKGGTILLNQIQTIDKSRVGKKIGKFGAKRMTEIDEALKVSLGLTGTALTTTN